MRFLLPLFLFLITLTAHAEAWNGGEVFSRLFCDVMNKKDAPVVLPKHTQKLAEYLVKEEIKCNSFKVILNDGGYLFTRIKTSYVSSENTPQDLIVTTLINKKGESIQSAASWFLSTRKIELGFTYQVAPDGAKLATLYGKSLDGSDATVLTRSPYLHTNLYCPGMLGIKYLAWGYSFACQGVRGTYLSEGDFKWLNPIEIKDGRSMIDWALEFFETKNIALIGTSYDGFASLASAIEAPEEVQLVIAGSAPTDVRRHSFTAGEITGHGLLNYYYTQENYVEILPGTQTYEKIVGYNSEHQTMTPDLMDDKFLGMDNLEWNYVIDNYADLNSPFWSERGIIDRLSEIKAPLYIIGGFKKDQDALDSFDNFKAVQEGMGEDGDYHFILGGWGHSYDTKMDKVLLDATFRGEENHYSSRILVYSQIEDALVEVEQFPLLDQEYISIDLGINSEFVQTDDLGVQTYIYDPSQIDYTQNEYQWSSSVTVDEGTYFTGVGTIELELEFSTPSVDLYFHLIVWDAKTDKYRWPLSSRLRKRIVNNGEGSQRVVIDIPPFMAKLNKGDKIYAGYRHFDAYTLPNYHSDEVGLEFFKEIDAVIIEWMTAPNIAARFNLPVEGHFEEVPSAEDSADDK